MIYPRDLRREFPSVFDRAYEQMRKNRHVKDIMSARVWSISPNKTMAEAAKVMGDRHIGSLLVKEASEPIGIVTERDLLTGVLAVGRDPADITVKDKMSAPLITVDSDATIKEASALMMRSKRRLVVRRGERVVGILTASDLIKSLPDAPETIVKVDELMTKSVVTSDGDLPVIRVAETMGKLRIGSVIVTENNEPQGIFTERDLLTTFLAKGRSLDVPVREFASKPIIYAPMYISVHEAAFIMSLKHIRRLPLYDDGKMKGIITARDLVEAYAK